MAIKKISHYKILKKIGEGGMGKVYLARDEILKREVALKILPPHTSFNKEARQRFQREAQIAAALNHPNIITIYELSEFQNRYYIAMEFIKGETLREKIEKFASEKNFPINEAIHIAAEICRGLEKAHQAQIIHRDIKPENILISSEGLIKISDFGLAKLKGSSKITSESTTLGTFYYMSPEQARGEAVDHRSDLFSLGILLYEMLTGQLPFKGEYNVAIVYALLNEAPSPIEQIRKDIPPALSQIVQRTLQKQPEDRYASAQELLNDLSRLFRNNLLSEQIPPRIPTNLAEIDPLIGNLSVAPGEPKSINELIRQRQKIDEIISHHFKRNICVMFADIVGSTAYFEKWGDLEGRTMLQRFYETTQPLIEKHEGKLIKTIGDAVLAYFGNPENAAQCAIDLMKTLETDNSKTSIENQIAIRIAMHYGSAMVDSLDVYGDVVNVAARVEKHAQKDQILVSGAFQAQLQNSSDFYWAPAGEITFRGKTQKTEMFALLWKETDLEQARNGHAYAARGMVKTDALHPSFAISSLTQAVKILEKYRVEIPEDPAESSLSHEMKNPYMNRVKIQNIQEFYGRQNEVKKIFTRIGASRPQSVSMVGERRIGKSSLLNFIYHPRNRMKHLQNPHDYVFVFIDFQEKRGITVQEFIQILYENFVKEFHGKLEISAPPSYEGLKKVIQAFEENNLKTIMLFDEFEAITKNKHFGPEFYSFFRSLANNYNVGYIVSSGRNLQSLCHSREISDSPFFNIFSNITLTQFTIAEAKTLILKPAQKMNCDMASYVPFILDIAGYYPFFIQMACAVCFHHARDGEPYSNALTDHLKEEFWDEAKVHFQQIWDICNDEKKEVLLYLSAGRNLPSSKEYVVKMLTKEGYVKLIDRHPYIFSSLLADFIYQNYASPKGLKRKRFLFW